MSFTAFREITRHLNKWLNHHAWWFLLAGFLGVLFHQSRLWRQDRRRLAGIKAVPPLPGLANWPRLPKVSALVAAWNEAADIESHIQSFLALRYPHKQLVLVAGGDDATYALACKFSSGQVIVLQQLPGEGKQRALRQGFDLTDGEIIYLTDADCLLDDLSFETLLYPIIAGKDLAVSGASMPSAASLSKPFIFSQFASQLYGSFHSPVYSPGLLGRNCAIERYALLRSSGLQFDTPSGTDYALAKMLSRSGVSIRQVPSSQVVSSYPISFKEYFYQQSRWMHNVAQLGRQFGAFYEVRSTWLSAVAGLGMLLVPLAGFFVGPAVVAGWGVLMFDGFFSRLRYGLFAVSLARQRVKAMYWLGIPIYLLVDFLVWAASIPHLMHRHAGWR
jgi:cellulose synthase/poly-beta-1,6-N-acetylglucosamine synthase-like glycosyltransferase